MPPQDEYGSEYVDDDDWKNSDGQTQSQAWLDGTDIFRTCKSPFAGMFVVTIIVTCVGLFLFLLPPVPGVPIYLTGGIILIATGTQYDNRPGQGNLFSTTTQNGDEGFLSIGMSIAWCFVMSLSLKLFACTCQQMGFGYMMKQSVAVRQAVGVNTHMVRTMKVILRRPGLDVAKVAILVGGPDWPTSVLCGIVGLDLLPVLFGTIPVSVLIFPTILAGTFVYIGSLKYVASDDDDGAVELLSFPWARTLTAVMLTVAAGVQTGSMFVAAYYLEKAVNESGDELLAMPFDEEVERADALAKSKELRYYEVRSWVRLPTFGRIILVLQVFLMTICGSLSNFSDLCFRDFEVTDDQTADLRPIAQCSKYNKEGVLKSLDKSEWLFYDGVDTFRGGDFDKLYAGYDADDARLFSNGTATDGTATFRRIDGHFMDFLIGSTADGGQKCGYGVDMMICYVISTVLFIIFGYYCGYLVNQDIKANPLPEVVLDADGRVVEMTDGQAGNVEAGAAVGGDQPGGAVNVAQGAVDPAAVVAAGSVAALLVQ